VKKQFDVTPAKTKKKYFFNRRRSMDVTEPLERSSSIIDFLEKLDQEMKSNEKENLRKKTFSRARPAIKNQQINVTINQNPQQFPVKIKEHSI